MDMCDRYTKVSKASQYHACITRPYIQWATILPPSHHRMSTPYYYYVSSRACVYSSRYTYVYCIVVLVYTVQYDCILVVYSISLQQQLCIVLGYRISVQQQIEASQYHTCITSPQSLPFLFTCIRCILQVHIPRYTHLAIPLVGCRGANLILYVYQLYMYNHVQSQCRVIVYMCIVILYVQHISVIYEQYMYITRSVCITHIVCSSSCVQYQVIVLVYSSRYMRASIKPASHHHRAYLLYLQSYVIKAYMSIYMCVYL